jgi:predicted nucleotidyltransferase
VVSRKIDIPMDGIEEFCRRWKIREFSLFGSVLREDFGPQSDVDVLVSFAPEAEWDLFHLVEKACATRSAGARFWTTTR